jgi:hypothetical protein
MFVLLGDYNSSPFPYVLESVESYRTGPKLLQVLMYIRKLTTEYICGGQKLSSILSPNNSSLGYIGQVVYRFACIRSHRTATLQLDDGKTTGSA